MEIFFAVAESKTNALDMALEAHCPSAGHDIKRENIPAFQTVNRTHHIKTGALPGLADVMGANRDLGEAVILVNDHSFKPR